MVTVEELEFQLEKANEMIEYWSNLAVLYQQESQRFQYVRTKLIKECEGLVNGNSR